VRVEPSFTRNIEPLFLDNIAMKIRVIQVNWGEIEVIVKLLNKGEEIFPA